MWFFLCEAKSLFCSTSADLTKYKQMYIQNFAVKFYIDFEAVTHLTKAASKMLFRPPD